MLPLCKLLYGIGKIHVLVLLCEERQLLVARKQTRALQHRVFRSQTRVQICHVLLRMCHTLSCKTNLVENATEGSQRASTHMRQSFSVPQTISSVAIQQVPGSFHADSKCAILQCTPYSNADPTEVHSILPVKTSTSY